jgi:putative flippase GtrA
MPRLLRYALVGAVATATHYAFLVIAQVAYVGNRGFTFAHEGAVGPSWWRFQATATLGALASMAIVALAQRLALHYLLGQVVATVSAMLGTYALNARWAFGSTRGRG